LAAARQGRSDEAVRCLDRACFYDPTSGEIHTHRAEILRQAGRLNLAREAAQQAVGFAPDLAAAHNNLGLVWLDLDEPGKARAAFEAAIARDPAYARAHYNLGNALLQADEPAAAEASLRRAVALQPSHVHAWAALGVALGGQSRFEEAHACFDRALALRPDDAKVYLNVGHTLVREKRYPEALQRYRQALALSPGYAEALVGQGNVYSADKRHDLAAECYRQALVSRPDWPEALHQLGGALFELEDYAEAKAILHRALAAKPDFPEAVATLLRVLSNTCDWDELPARVAELRAAAEKALAAGKKPPISSSQANAYDFSMAEKLAFARAHSHWLEERQTPVRAALDFRHPEPSSATPGSRHPARDSDPARLRIGYWSYDLRNHATAHLMRTVFGLHDRARFEVFTYSYGPDDGSDYRAQIAAESDHFVDLREVGDAQAARRIHADGIHILVDLMGYVANCRPEVLALRPAPIQVNYLGYPGTMGADFMDYVVTDRVTTPAADVPFIHEAIVYLPHTYQVTDDQQAIDPHPVTRAGEGLPESGVVYCCFNTLYKIEPTMFGAWMRILAAVPKSVLWLLAKPPAARENLRREAAAAGVDPGRLVFAEGKHKPLHLARLRLADLFLDTRYYNAHTTTSDALWAGVPVLTWPGDGFPARVAASLLSAIDLPDLIVPSLADYEREAIRLGTDPAALAALKMRLAEHRSTRPLFDTRRWVRDFEWALAAMWARYAAGEAPGEIAVPAEIAAS
jgi:predicted O-linked N-acetylglucosamine transferase (SPINDLY family)